MNKGILQRIWETFDRINQKARKRKNSNEIKRSIAAERWSLPQANKKLFDKIISLTSEHEITQAWIEKIWKILHKIHNHKQRMVIEIIIDSLADKSYQYIWYKSFETFVSNVETITISEKTIEMIKALIWDEENIFCSDEEWKNISYDDLTIKPLRDMYYTDIFTKSFDKSIHHLIKKWVIKTRTELAFCKQLCATHPDIIKVLLSVPQTQLTFTPYQIYSFNHFALTTSHKPILHIIQQYITTNKITQLESLVWNNFAAWWQWISFDAFIGSLNKIYDVFDTYSLTHKERESFLEDFFPWFTSNPLKDLNIFLRYSSFGTIPRPIVQQLIPLFMQNKRRYTKVKDIILQYDWSAREKSDRRHHDKLTYQDIIYFIDDFTDQDLSIYETTTTQQILKTKISKKSLYSFVKQRWIEDINNWYGHFIFDMALQNNWSKKYCINSLGISATEADLLINHPIYSQEFNLAILSCNKNDAKNVIENWHWYFKDWRWKDKDHNKIFLHHEQIRKIIEKKDPHFYKQTTHLRTTLKKIWSNLHFFANHQAKWRKNKMIYLEWVANILHNNPDTVDHILEIAIFLSNTDSPQIDPIKLSLIQQLYNHPDAKKIIREMSDYFLYNHSAIFHSNEIFQHTNNKEVFNNKMKSDTHAKCHIPTVITNKENYEKVREIFYVDSLKTLLNSNPENIKDIISVMKEGDTLTKKVRWEWIESLSYEEKYSFFLFIKYCETLLISSRLPYNKKNTITVENIWETFTDILQAWYCSPQRKPSESIAKIMLNPYGIESFSDLWKTSQDIRNQQWQRSQDTWLTVHQWDIMKWVSSEYLLSYCENWFCAPEFLWPNALQDTTFYWVDIWVISDKDCHVNTRETIQKHVSYPYGDFNIILHDNRGDLHRTYSEQKVWNHTLHYKDLSKTKGYNPLSIDSPYEVSCSQRINSLGNIDDWYVSHQDEYEIRHSIWRHRIDAFVLKKWKEDDTCFCEKLFFHIVGMWGSQSVYNEKGESLFPDDQFVEKNKQIFLNPPTKDTLGIYNDQDKERINKNIQQTKILKEALWTDAGDATLNAEVIMNILQKNNFFHQHFVQKTWVDGKNEILWEHTLSVLINYEKQYKALSNDEKKKLFPQWSCMTHELMRLCVVLHDIGKWYAFNTLGNKNLQHEVSTSMIYNIMETMWYSRKEIWRVIALIDQDIMWNIFASQWSEADIDACVSELKSHAIKNHCEPTHFFNLLKLFTLCDGSTYSEFSWSFTEDKAHFNDAIRSTFTQIEDKLLSH